ncbi:carbohydrate ABC transporter permease [Microbacterium sp. YMB-B2]|uniref:Carbohydrate ABC transporter permease n=1 Tax=Microbacterium tenebrionis TaxID=2830665 RepID=A0A9X1RYT4_9MICO|nr:carbohydrate ABC transporter permease [Microbacterium tenebrionis]MCC2028871.1 carbohydrate ABC transporter permease [Microbacterium tenebrionis]
MRSPKPIALAVNYTVLSIVVVVLLLPFVWVFFGSFKSQEEFLTDPGALLPESFQLTNYVLLFTEKGFGTYFGNSIVVSVIAVLANTLFASMAGYALAKLNFPGRRVLLPFVIVAMVVPYVALFVPQFLIVVQLRLVDTLAGIVAPFLIMPMSVFIMRQAAYSLPTELLEAARIDGAGEFRLYARIFLPLSGPALATVAILSFLGSWNQLLWPLVVAQSQGTYTLPVGLAIASQTANSTDFGMLLAGAVVILLPVLVLFLFLQKYFIQGLATTGLK